MGIVPTPLNENAFQHPPNQHLTPQNIKSIKLIDVFTGIAAIKAGANEDGFYV